MMTQKIKSVSNDSPDDIEQESRVIATCGDEPDHSPDNMIATSEPSSLMPLDYLLSLITDNAVDIRLRISAAKAAAPYLHVRQSVSGSAGDQHEISHDDAIDALE